MNTNATKRNLRPVTKKVSRIPTTEIRVVTRGIYDHVSKTEMNVHDCLFGNGMNKYLSEVDKSELCAMEISLIEALGLDPLYELNWSYGENPVTPTSKFKFYVDEIKVCTKNRIVIIVADNESGIDTFSIPQSYSALMSLFNALYDVGYSFEDLLRTNVGKIAESCPETVLK